MQSTTTLILKAVAWVLAASFASAAPSSSHTVALQERQSTDRLVFCHFMIGIVGERTSAADFDLDMTRAKSLGIDAFALNIGVDSYTDTQLGYAYQSAANNGMNVFISFDFNWWDPSTQAVAIGQKIAQYASLPAQLMVDGKAFASSFAGDQLNVTAMKSAAGIPIFFAPNFHPQLGTNFSEIDGALNWLAWPNNGNNKAPTPGANVTVEAGDTDYINALAGKPYIAPVSAWFSTHYGPEVSYSKNWVFPSDLLWFQRWNEILTLGSQFLEIITWNDYGESHYIGPLDSPHFDDGNSKWTNDMPHDGWLDMAKPFISAFHDGATSPSSYITSDQLIYWYRPNLRSLDCDATDTTMVPGNNASGNYFEGRPNGWEDMQDSIFVASMLTAPGTVTIMSGNNTQQFDAPAGVTAFQVDMEVGQQQFFLQRDGAIVLEAVSLHNVTDVCICGIYNFNAYVGTVPDSASDSLQPAGLSSLTVGLHVSTCSATPSLATTTIKPTVTPPGGGSTVTTTTTSTSTSTTTSTSTSTTTLTSTSTTTSTSTSTSTTSSSTSSTTSTTSIISSTSTISTTTSTSAAPTTTSTSSSVCIAGTGPGNYVGLCSFCCNYGYCPPGPCTCTAYGAQVPPPPITGTAGYPLPDEDDSYLGLCSYACNHGYCPPTACTT